MKKHSVTLRGHATSITLENEFWVLLKQIAVNKNQSIASLIDDIDEKRLETSITIKKGGLSSALRVYVLNYVIAQTDQTNL